MHHPDRDEPQLDVLEQTETSDYTAACMAMVAAAGLHALSIRSRKGLADGPDLYRTSLTVTDDRTKDTYAAQCEIGPTHVEVCVTKTGEMKTTYRIQFDPVACFVAYASESEKLPEPTVIDLTDEAGYAVLLRAVNVLFDCDTYERDAHQTP